nr:carbohydrate-binding domain-containing protein [Akkermansia muciniphila]
MKLHLPVALLSAVLACYSVAVLTASAETLTSNVTISTDTIWNETTIIGANGLTLTIESGKTLTQAEGAFNIGNNSLTITGGGVFRIKTAATQKIGSDPISKTLTINNATLDLSAPDASLNSGGYTRCRVTVTDGGVLRVGEYSYNGLGQMATNTDYWTLNNKGRLELTKEENGEFGCGLTVAAGGRRRGGGECLQHRAHDGIFRPVDSVERRPDADRGREYDHGRRQCVPGDRQVDQGRFRDADPGPCLLLHGRG